MKKSNSFAGPVVLLSCLEMRLEKLTKKNDPIYQPVWYMKMVKLEKVGQRT